MRRFQRLCLMNGVQNMRKQLLILIVIVVALASCGGNSPASNPAQPARPNAPAVAPTLQLTPPGLPTGGFPMLDAPLDGQIVFSNGDGDIYVVDVRPNAQPKKIISPSNSKGFVQEPQWSADGQHIVYTYLLPFDTSGLPSSDLMVTNADGSLPQVIATHQLEGETFATPSFSIDGRAIYYSHTKPIYKDKQIISATVTLERLDLVTKQATAIADDGQQPAVSPDDKRVVFIKTDPDTFEQTLITIDPDGKNAQVVVPGNSLGSGIHSPRWTRDGKRILFAVPNLFAKRSRPADGLARWFDQLFDVRVAEAHGPPWDFWIVDANGKNLQRVTEIGEDMPYATFSPDGKNLAFMGLAGLYVLDANGKNVHWLIRDGGHGRLDWKK
jgi:Tol biopolymer transport system component